MVNKISASRPWLERISRQGIARQTKEDTIHPCRDDADGTIEWSKSVGTQGSARATGMGPPLSAMPTWKNPQTFWPSLPQINIINIHSPLFVRSTSASTSRTETLESSICELVSPSTMLASDRLDPNGEGSAQATCVEACRSRLALNC